MIRDSHIQNGLSRVMVTGVITSAAIITMGVLWYLGANAGLHPGDHVFSGEPKYFENPISMMIRAFNLEETGHRRSLTMIGVMLLLLNPVIRVAFALVGFALQKDRLYTGVSMVVLSVLLFSFFW